MLRNTATTYGSIARVLHWLTALLILLTLAIAVYMDTLSADVPGDPQRYFVVLPWHKTFGVLVLALFIVRLPWSLANPHPVATAATPPWQHSIARAAHWSLYGLMFLLPVLGWLGSSAQRSTFKLFTLWPMPQIWPLKDLEVSELFYEIHVGLGWACVVIVVVHVGAALWHQWVLKDRLLGRMGIGPDPLQ